ncbi:MAG TPA: alpha-1,2-fucosyltransferase [Balneolaceae bacterium]|nr:alpha-1,2-fucosyltransferase [Balneolaceae bacterium]
MVIIQTKSGRLANRLHIFSWFIANSIEHGYALANPTFDEYCRYFPSTRENDFGDLPISVIAPLNLPYKVFFPVTSILKRIKPSGKRYEFVRSEKSPSLNLNNPDFVRLARTKNVYVSGWYFRDSKNMSKHKDIVRSLFTPDEEVMDRISNRFSRIRKKDHAIVGVHIRRGDYRRWQGGIYFLEDNEYAEKMKALEQHFNAEGKSVSFLLCSNEPVQAENFKEFLIHDGPGDMISDLYSLAACDYVIGPPSTYSMWASFYGGKPLLHIRKEKQEMDLSSFDLRYP